MQTRDNENSAGSGNSVSSVNSGLLDKDSYYTKALNTTPTPTQSAFDGLYMGLTVPNVAEEAIDKTYSQTPDGQGALSAFKAAQLEKDAPGQGFLQRRGNDLAYMVGSALNPITWVGGAAGEAAADVIGSTAGKFLGNSLGIMARTPLTELLPKQISRYVPDVINDQPLSTAFLGEHALKSATTGMGAMLPQGIVDNYNADTKHINWGGVAKSTGEMGALGVAIGTIPMAYGILKAKLGEALPEGEELNQAVLDKALKNGSINSDEHGWMSDFLIAKKTPGDQALMADLETRATKMVGDNGLPVNTVTHESPVHLINDQNIDALQNGLVDGGLSGLPDESKSALADFVVHNSIDSLGENPKAIDGIRGYLELTKDKLDAREEKTAEADQILDNHLTKNMSDNMALSQKSLLRTMNKFGMESSHVDNLPITIPSNIRELVQKQEQLKALNKKLKIQKAQSPAKKKFAVERKIEQVEASRPKTLTPKEEIQHLRNKLLGKGLDRNFQRSKEYQRLMDLSNFWPNAHTLLDRVHLEDEYNRQSALHGFLSDIVKIADGNLPQLARPENVTDYLRQRIEEKIFPTKNDAALQAEVKEYAEVPQNSAEILNNYERDFEKTDAVEAKNDFMNAKRKMEEFKSREGVFKTLISCVMGALHGQE